MRWASATAVAGALLMATATGAQAATTTTPLASKADAIRTPDHRENATAAPRSSSQGHQGYRGIQGANFCLLSRCTVGDSSGGDSTGPSNTQGVNFCLLALCTVRP